MNLNDPFGRLARRDERDYQSLRAALKKEGVHNREKVNAVLERLRRRLLSTMAAVVVVTLLSMILFPKFGVVSFVSGILALLWLIKLMTSGRRHIKRYVKEDLTQ